MRPRKPRNLKLSVKKLPKVGTISVIKGPGNLSTFQPPLDVAPEKRKEVFED